MRSAPLPGEKHLTATVYILSRELPKRVLLVHHVKTGMWMPPGGHVEFGENPYDTAIREVKEEAGMDISSLLPAPVDVDGHSSFLPLPKYFLEEKVPAHGDHPAHVHLDCVYLVEAPQTEVIHDTTESHAIGWFTHEETFALETWGDIRVSLKELMT